MTSFKDQLAADAQNVFCNTDEFAEAAKYHARDGTITDVKLVPDHNPPRRNPGPGAGKVAFLMVFMPKSTTGGRLAVYPGAERIVMNGRTYMVAEIANEDAGGFLLELR